MDVDRPHVFVIVKMDAMMFTFFLSARAHFAPFFHVLLCSWLEGVCTRTSTRYPVPVPFFVLYDSTGFCNFISRSAFQNISYTIA
jgi:hypothetical protein